MARESPSSGPRSNQAESWEKASPSASPPTGVMTTSLIDTASLNSTSSQAREAPKLQAKASGMETRFPRAIR